MKPESENPLYLLQDYFTDYMKESATLNMYGTNGETALVKYMEHIKENQKLKRYAKEIIIPLLIKEPVKKYLNDNSINLDINYGFFNVSDIREAITYFHNRIIEYAKSKHLTLKPQLLFDIINYKIFLVGTKFFYDFETNTNRWKIVKNLMDNLKEGRSRASLVKDIGKNPKFDTHRKLITQEIKDINKLFKKRMGQKDDLIIKITRGTTTYWLNFERYEMYT